MIAGWLAGKISGIIIFLIACLSIVLLPAVVIQTVRINGISVFGWYAVSGYKPLYEADERDLVTLRGNQRELQRGLDTCNASVTSLKTASDALNKATQALIEQRLKEAEQFQSRINAVQAIKSTGAKCPSVDNVFQTGFK